MVQIHPYTFARPLQYGDEFTAIAASSVVSDNHALLNGVKILESWGLVHHPQLATQRNWGYFAGDDSVRYNQLHPSKPSPLQVFARGGWGAARLLEQHQPWKPGLMLGFSDVTSLLLSRLSAGFDGGIHGPLLTSLSNEPIWSQERLRSLLFGNSIPDLFGESWNSQIATGPLVIANLTVGSHLIGSSHMPDLKGSILILEDVGEAPYRIDRMLTQWRLAGLLQVLAGLGLGSFTECEAPKEEPLEQTFQIQEVLKERTKDLQMPIISNLPIGHSCGNAALPQGRIATLNGEKGLLSLHPS